jgi:uncharacterized membrane protein
MLQSLIICSPFLIILGAIISLIALLPPLRRVIERSSAALIVTAIVLGLVSFSISHTGSTRLGARIQWIFADVFIYHDRGVIIQGEWVEYEEIEMIDDAIINEFWVRAMIPPLPKSLCLTGNLLACGVADQFAEPGVSVTPWEGLITGFTTFIMVWLISKRRPRLHELITAG